MTKNYIKKKPPLALLATFCSLNCTLFHENRLLNKEEIFFNVKKCFFFQESQKKKNFAISLITPFLFGLQL